MFSASFFMVFFNNFFLKNISIQAFIIFCRFFLVYKIDTNTKAGTLDKVLMVLNIRVFSIILL